MSRIETRNNPNITQTTPSGDAVKNSKLINNAATPQAVQRFTKIRDKFVGNKKIAIKKTKRLVAASDIEEVDLQPLSGKNRDEMMGDLSRILVSLTTYEQSRGTDETSQLCKMMLSEHVRRLSLISGTEVVSDGLKGSA